MKAAGMAAVAGAACGAIGADNSREGGLHEASYYEPLENKRVRCLLCPRGCITGDRQRGSCRVRENRGGKYYTLVYNRPCTVTHDDPIEKKPFFHVCPGTKVTSLATVGCNFTCKFCQNWEISQLSPEDLPDRRVTPEQIAKMAVTRDNKTVSYTYTEPIIFYEYMVDCAKAAKEQGLRSVMVSNGFINEKPLKALIPHMAAIKIDFKGFTQKFYGETCGGQLEPVKDTLKTLAGSGIWFEIVNLVIPALNDNLDDIKRMSAWIIKELGPNVALHFTRFHPDHRLRNLPPTPADTLRSAWEVAKKEGCNYVYTGGTPGDTGENTYCPKCKSLLVRRAGFAIISDEIKKGKCYKCGNAIPGVWA